MVVCFFRTFGFTHALIKIYNLFLFIYTQYQAVIHIVYITYQPILEILLHPSSFYVST